LITAFTYRKIEAQFARKKRMPKAAGRGGVTTDYHGTLIHHIPLNWHSKKEWFGRDSPSRTRTKSAHLDFDTGESRFSGSRPLFSPPQKMHPPRSGTEVWV